MISRSNRYGVEIESRTIGVPVLSDSGLSDSGLSDSGLSDSGLGDSGLGDSGLSDSGLRRLAVSCSRFSPGRQCCHDLMDLLATSIDDRNLFSWLFFPNDFDQIFE